MAKRKKTAVIQEYMFHEQLWYFYTQNRKKIRPKYKHLTQKFLDYNDKEKNPGAFLRERSSMRWKCMPF